MCCLSTTYLLLVQTKYRAQNKNYSQMTLLSSTPVTKTYADKFWDEGL